MFRIPRCRESAANQGVGDGDDATARSRQVGADRLGRTVQTTSKREAKGRSANTLDGYRRYIEREISPVLGSIRLSKLTGSMSTASTTPSPSGDWSAATWPSWPRPLRHPNRSSTRPPPKRSELCAVRWGDLDAKTLTVARSHIALPGVRGDKETKTRSTRTVILDDATVEVLAQLRESRAEIGTADEQEGASHVDIPRPLPALRGCKWRMVRRGNLVWSKALPSPHATRDSRHLPMLWPAGHRPG